MATAKKDSSRTGTGTSRPTPDAPAEVQAIPIPPGAGAEGGLQGGTGGGGSGVHHHHTVGEGEEEPALESKRPSRARKTGHPTRDVLPEGFKAAQFPKGKSGNPGGRKALDPVVKKLLHDATPDAVRTIIAMASSEKTPPRERLAASLGILERVYGKAVQPIDAEVGGTAGVIVVQLQGDLAEWGK